MSEETRARLLATIGWARRIRQYLQPILSAHGSVHFRPASTGIAMVGLLHERPQRGRSGITNLERLAERFETEFRKHCIDIDQGRPTREKELQSFLIADAYRHSRLLASLNAASARTTDPVELTFVTDEISLPVDDGKKSSATFWRFGRPTPGNSLC